MYKLNEQQTILTATITTCTTGTIITNNREIHMDKCKRCLK